MATRPKLRVLQKQRWEEELKIWQRVIAHRCRWNFNLCLVFAWQSWMCRPVQTNWHLPWSFVVMWRKISVKLHNLTHYEKKMILYSAHPPSLHCMSSCPAAQSLKTGVFSCTVGTQLYSISDKQVSECQRCEFFIYYNVIAIGSDGWWWRKRPINQIKQRIWVLTTLSAVYWLQSYVASSRVKPTCLCVSPLLTVISSRSSQSITDHRSHLLCLNRRVKELLSQLYLF